MAWVFAQWEPVAGGRLVLLAAGLVTTLTAPMVNPGLQGYEILAAVTVAMTVFLLASFVVPWSRMPRLATVAFPVLVFLAVGTLGVGDHGLGKNFAGLFPLCFAYLGLTQRVKTSLFLAPLGAACYVVAYGGWAWSLAPRLVIAVCVWLLLAVLIAELVHRQLLLTGELSRAAHTDVLTGLGNRRDLDHRVALARLGDTVVICDLDHFKTLNDTQGHAAGDRVLAEFGRVLSAGLRRDDYAGRYGGEEFALVLPDTNASEAATTLARLRGQWAILQPDVTFSAGIATCRSDRTPSETIAVADQALYAAKAAGRNQDIAEQVPLRL
jgi:diguanylate cyclase (GGDEF)-like protein